MPRLLSAVGVVSYNGFTFPAPLNAEVSVQTRYDSSNRVVKFHTYTINIRAIIVSDDAPTSTANLAVDDNIENIRCRLLKAGGSLKFIGQGMGTDFVINDDDIYVDPSSGANVASYKIDHTYGPKPLSLLLRPVGSNRAIEIVWTVEVTIPGCCDDSPRNNLNFDDYTYTVAWDISSEGITSRIIQGRLEVPGYRLTAKDGLTDAPGDRLIFQHADQVWNDIYATFPLIDGFRRDQRRSLSQDRKVLEFTITDTEIGSDNPLFPYMVRMDVAHNASASLPFVKWSSSLSGAIEIAPGTPKSFAWIAFRKILEQRFKFARDLMVKNQGQKETKDEIYRPLLTSLSMTELLYGRRLQFSAEWWFTADLKTVFQGTGLFTPVVTNPDSAGELVDWRAWTGSMFQIVYSARSLANLGFRSSDDIILTSCDTTELPTNNTIVRKYTTLYDQQQPPYPDDPPPKEQSYVNYDQVIYSNQETNTVRHRKTQYQSPDSARSTQLSGSTADGHKLDNYVGESQSDSEAHSTQVRGPSTTTIRVQGRATRVGYKIPIPKVQSVGGQPATVRAAKALQRVIGKTVYCLPIYGAAWFIDLILPGTPAGDLMSQIETDGLPEQHSYS